MAYDVYCMCLLLLCGDVELNPGPDDPSTRELLEKILLGQTKLTEEVAALRTQHTSMEKRLADWDARFSEIEKQTVPVDNLERTVKFLDPKITDLEDRSRRSNLVVFGVSEDEDETKAVFRRKVLTDIFSTKLEITCKSVGRIHRLGRPGKSRPVILYFQDYEEKQQIMKIAYKLKGTSTSIQNDYSRNTLRKRKLLWDSASEERAKKESNFN